MKLVGREGVELGAEGGVGGRAVEDAVEEGLNVEGGAADDDGQDVAGAEVIDFGVGEGEPLFESEGIGSVRVGDIDEVVGGAGAFAGGGLGGADIHAAIDLKGVGGDEFAGGGVGG